MTTRDIDKDPRTPDQRRADEEVLRAFEDGEFLNIPQSARTEAIEKLRAKNMARQQAAELGATLGKIRRIVGITQEELALSMGTQKSNISRLESGRYGGLSIETVLSLCSALQVASGVNPLVLAGHRVTGTSMFISQPELRHFASPRNCLESDEAA